MDGGVILEAAVGAGEAGYRASVSTWRELQRLDAERPWLLDAGLALGVAAAAMLSAGTTAAPAQLGLIAVIAAGYALRRRAPLTVLVTTGALVVTMIALGYTTAVIGAGLFLVAYTVAAHRPLRATLIGAGYALTLLVAIAAAFPARMPWEALGTNIALFVGAFVLGRAARLQRRTARLEAERAALASRMRDEETRHAVTEERLRIARELHDVVGHSLGVIALQAGVCARIVEADPVEARAGMLAIADRSRSSLREVRQILGAVREPDGPLVATPGLADADALFAGFRDAGLAVEVERTGTPWPLPTTLDHAAYRVLQEALTNVVRHASTDRAWVRIGFTPESLELRIRDRGVGGYGPPAGGLAGMRERVTACGGRLSAGAAAEAGYEVVVTLPRHGEGDSEREQPGDEGHSGVGEPPMEMPPAAGAGRTTLGGEQPPEKARHQKAGLPRNGDDR